MQNNGFTLIELVIVTAMLGIIGVFTVIFMPSKTPLETKNTALLLFQDLNLTKSIAMGDGATPYQLVIHSSASTYSIVYYFSVSALLTNQYAFPYINPQTNSPFVINYPQGVTIAVPPSLNYAAISFHSTGQPYVYIAANGNNSSTETPLTSPLTYTVTQTGSSSPTYLITVTPITGLVTLTESNS